ncbi:MAG: hypothetical protein L6R41_002485 [Letrouitia leprolyta]|nr:MAG: hypothetical protein L6R41_002485 [Letrouitia leprolyta]
MQSPRPIQLTSLWSLFCLFACLIVHTSASTISVGAAPVSQSRRDSGANTCGDPQEFNCVNDICDQCATNDACRKGEESEIIVGTGWGATTCPPGQKCTNTPGHCLENKWCASGRHTTPPADGSLGTPKFFKCVAVADPLPANGVIVVFTNHDFTGDACFIPSEGIWATPGDQKSQAIVAEPIDGNFTVCRKGGQPDKKGTVGPADSGFLLGATVPVVGASIAGAIGISDLFAADPAAVSAANEAAGESQEEEGENDDDDDDNQQQKCTTDDDDNATEDGEDDLVCPFPKRLIRRASNTPSSRLKKVVNYGSVYNKPFWTAGDPTTAPMKVYQTRTEGTSGNENCRHKADVDHIVEAQSIIEFFSGPNPKPTFIDQAKWDSLVSAVMTGTPETKNPPAPATPGFKELGTALGALNNLQAIDARVNSMKGKIMAKGTCDWAKNGYGSWKKSTAEVLRTYLGQVQDIAFQNAQDIGSAADDFLGTKDRAVCSSAFKQRVTEIWQAALGQLGDRLADDSVTWKPE